MGCRCCKYSKWREHIASKTATPPEYVENAVLEIATNGSTLAIYYNGKQLGDSINLAKFEGKEIPVKLANSGSTVITAGMSYEGDTIISANPIPPGSFLGATWEVPTLNVGDMFIIVGPNQFHVTDYHRFSLNQIDYGTTPYDFTEMADYFDRHYDCWYIVNPCCDFVKELQLCYDGAKERLDAYYNYLTSEFNPKENTVMDVDYGARKTTGKDYTYPITGDVTTSTPNAGAVTDTDAVKDTTTVTKDTDPFKTLERLKAMESFKEYFVKQFIDCFTITSGVTW